MAGFAVIDPLLDAVETNFGGCVTRCLCFASDYGP